MIRALSFLWPSKRRENRDCKRAPDERERDGDRHVIKTGDKHLRTDEHQDRGKPVMQEVEELDHSREGEVKRSQSENREHVRGVDDERVRADRQDRGNRVGRENHVGSLDEKQNQKQRSRESSSTDFDEELRLMGFVVAGMNRNDFLEKLHYQAIDRVELFLFLESKLDAREDEERAEYIDDPIEFLDECDAYDDEDRPHDERAENSPEQHFVLIFLRDLEILKNKVKHEDVVDAQGFLDDVPGEELKSGLLSHEMPKARAEDH